VEEMGVCCTRWIYKEIGDSWDKKKAAKEELDIPKS
jgi:hypothetical protein